MDHGEGLPYALEPMYISEGKDYISEDGKEADGYVKMCIRDRHRELGTKISSPCF